jgi:hypothetical protein
VFDYLNGIKESRKVRKPIFSVIKIERQIVYEQALLVRNAKISRLNSLEWNVNQYL